MAKLLGESINLGVGSESTRGTGVAPQKFIPARSPSGVMVKLDKTLIRETRSSGMMSRGSEITQKRAEGDLEFNVRSESIGFLLKSLLGKVTTVEKSGGDAGVYDHTFEVLLNNPQHPSLTLALSQPNFQDYQYTNAVVSSLELSTPVDDLVQATANFIATNENEHSDYTTNFETDDYYFRHYDVTIKLASDVSGLDAETGVCLKEFSISINNNSRPEQCIGSLNAQDILAMLIEVGGSLTLDYKDKTYHDIFTNGTYQAMRLELTRSDITLGATANPKIVVTLPKISFEDYGNDRPLDDVVKESIPFQAHYDDTEAEGIKVVVTNEVTSY